MHLAPGTVVGDRYVVEGTLGHGGMAVVYRVRHRTLGTTHALKLVGATHPSARERLLREGQLQGRLQHPNVVAVTDQLEISGVPALVLELVDGPSLSQLVGSSLSTDQIDALGEGILAGVAAAHALGLVHRDLKPGNVLITVENGRAVPKVTDFGLAVEPEGDRTTRTGVTLGTPEYMAPEQVRSAKDVDARADVWALGVLLYELCTGQLPFDDPDRFGLFQKITSGDHVPIASRRPDLPERMRRTIESALQVDRAARPPDAAALRRTWSAEVRETRLDDLADRIQRLAPSASSSSGGFSGAGPTKPQATWAPLRETYAVPPAPSESLPPPPAPALHRGSNVARPVLLGWGLAVSGALLAVLAITALVVVWALRAEPRVAVVTLPVEPPPALDVEELERPGRAGFQPPVKAEEALNDARFLEVVDVGHFFLATSDKASILVATGSEALGNWYTAREEITKSAKDGGPETLGEALAGTLAGRAESLDRYTAAHPEDKSAHLWRVWTLCPGPHCAETEVDLTALAVHADGRGITEYARQYVRRAQGRWDEAETALAAWEAGSPGEPSVALERARLALARGTAAEVGPLLDTLPDTFPRRTPWVDILRARAALQLGDEVGYQAVAMRMNSATPVARYLFAVEVVPGLVAAGRTSDADLLLASAIGGVYLRDEVMRVAYADLMLRRAELAVQRGDRATVDESANVVKAEAAAGHELGWTAERTQRLALVAEGVRMVSRGNREAGARRLAELEALDPRSPELERLRRVLGP
jgi:serine/threonine-protein kinase